MCKFKFLFLALFAFVLVGTAFVSCKDKDDPKDDGVKAGTEMCDCVSSVETPVQPQHPSSPLPPANFNPYLDYTDPEVLASLDIETMTYLMDPAIQAYFGQLAAFSAAFEAYAGELYQCLGVIQKYQDYATANVENYNPEAEDPLLSVFTFTDNDFKEGFKEGVQTCYDTFSSLFLLLGNL